MKKSSIIEFLKSQVAAFGSTLLDYATVIFLTEIMGLWYVFSNIIGASLGAISNFFLGRYWTFNAQEGPVGHQAGKYALVSSGSLLLNTSGLYLLTEWTTLHYILSKLIVGIVIAICFNYFLQKHFVFK